MKYIEIYDHDSAEVFDSLDMPLSDALITFANCPSCESSLAHGYSDLDDGWPLYSHETTLWCCPACGFWYGKSDMQRFGKSGENDGATVIARLNTFDLSGLEIPYQNLVSWLSRNPKDVYFINPRRFERIVRDILQEAIAVDFSMTTQSRDGGIDLVGFDGDQKIIVEVKRYASSRKIGVRFIRQLAGVLIRENARRGLLVTSSDFTRPGKTEAAMFSSVDRVYPIEIELRTFDELFPWLEIVALKLHAGTETEDYWRQKVNKFLRIPWAV